MLRGWGWQCNSRQTNTHQIECMDWKLGRYLSILDSLNFPNLYLILPVFTSVYFLKKKVLQRFIWILFNICLLYVILLNQHILKVISPKIMQVPFINVNNIIWGFLCSLSLIYASLYAFLLLFENCITKVRYWIAVFQFVCCFRT